jgi:hypothetical protein
MMFNRRKRVVIWLDISKLFCIKFQTTDTLTCNLSRSRDSIILKRSALCRSFVCTSMFRCLLFSDVSFFSDLGSVAVSAEKIIFLVRINVL